LWETIDGGKFRITWTAERKIEYQFDFLWNSFHEAENVAAVYHVMQ